MKKYLISPSLILLIFLSLAFVACDKKTSDSASSSTSKKPPQGNTFFINLSKEPEVLHPINSTGAYATRVQDYIIESLMTRDIKDYSFKPQLAVRYTVSPDKKVYTFYLRKDAKFHDGKPVTAEDVKFTYDAVFDNNFKATSSRPYLESIKEVKVLDPHTIRYTLKNVYYKNFEVLAGMQAIPKHIYKDHKNKKLNKILVGSGPYRLAKYNKGKNIILEKNPEWWGNNTSSPSTSYYKGMYNFERIFMRFIKEEEVQVQVLKKGNLDYLGLRAEAYVKKTKGKPFGETVFKKKVTNNAPRGYGYVGWNLRNPLFTDRDVRVALAHLMNRKLMNEKFNYGLDVLATGPWYRQNPYANPNVKPIEFNPQKARALLKKAGWRDSDKDGVLDKVIKGKKVDFRFELLNSNKDQEKYLTVYKEDLSKEGVAVSIKHVDWNSFLKLLDERKFDAVRLGWTGSVEVDPKQIWHSSSIANQGSNFIGYKNKKVDALIEKGRRTIDRKKRIKIFREVYRLIANDAPYLFMFNAKYTFYAYNNSIKQVRPTYTYGIGTDWWWKGNFKK